jgi:hypothetical protein
MSHAEHPANVEIRVESEYEQAAFEREAGAREREPDAS